MGELGYQLLLARVRYEQLRRRLSLEYRRQETLFERLRAAFYDRFWREAAGSIGADIEWLGYGFYRLTRAGRWTLVKDSKVMLDDHVTLEMTGSKPLTNAFLREAGCPFPRFAEYDLRTLDTAREFLRSVGGRGVVKPASGTGGGVGVTTKIRHGERLKRASWHAATFHRSLLIEQEIPGHSYRLLYLDGKLIDAIQRDPPTVVGDGTRTVRQLMQEETAARLRDTGSFRSLIPLTEDLECAFSLEEQGLTITSVPAVDQRVAVKSVINQNGRSENHSVRDRVDPSLERMGSRIVTSMGVRLAGLDLITTDIGVPLEAGGGVINEVNAPPGLHYHVLVSDPAKAPPVGAVILDTVLSGSQRRRSQVTP